MSVLNDDENYWNNPWVETYGKTKSDYSGFYVGISICTVLGLAIIVLNFVFCCCSPYKNYWRDPNTGNRLLLPLWIHSPKQPPLTLEPELSEAKEVIDRIKV